MPARGHTRTGRSNKPMMPITRRYSVPVRERGELALTPLILLLSRREFGFEFFYTCFDS